jgi:hypothetical protein
MDVQQRQISTIREARNLHHQVQHFIVDSGAGEGYSCAEDIAVVVV